MINEFKLPMCVLNWNVRGLGDIDKCAVIKDVLIENKPDLVCFQETKWSSCTIFDLRRVCPTKIKKFVTLDAEGTRGGILLAWSNRFPQLDTFKFTFTITTVLKRRDLTFMCTGVYGPQDDASKRLFLEELRMIRALNDFPWIILGDFNLFRTLEETTGIIRNVGTMIDFNNFINEAGLIEAPLQGRSFTWSNRRPNPTFSKLDRVLLSYHWQD